MPIDAKTQRVGRGFDRLTGIYDGIVNVVFGDALNALQRNASIELGAANRIAIIGGGSGVLLPFILDKTKADRIDYIELSAGMRKKAQQRLSFAQLQRVTFQEKMNEDTQGYDLICLPFILDCYSEASVRQMLQGFCAVLTDNGSILITDFSNDPATGYQRSFLKETFIKTLYLFFRFMTGIEARALAPFDTIAKEIGLKQEFKLGKFGYWVQSTQWIKPAAQAPAPSQDQSAL